MIDVLYFINSVSFNFFVLLYGLLPLLFVIFTVGLVLGIFGNLLNLVFYIGKNE